MKRRPAMLLLVGAALVAGIAFGNSAVQDDAPAMMVSPQTIVLAKVATVTIHTNIPFGSVLPGSLTLDDVEPLAVWADDCGHIAARFAVKDLQDRGLATGKNVVLTLTGTYVNGGDTFEAKDTVRVK